MSEIAREAHVAGSAVSWPVELDPAGVRERIRAARKSGRPRYLWPDVAPSAWREGLREIERVTRVALSNDRTSIAAKDPRALGIAAFTSGMGPLLGFWLEHGRIDAPEPLRSLLALHLHHGRERARLQSEILATTLATLHEHGIEPIILKSAATGDVYFPDPAVRPSLDIDLAVDPDAFAAAEQALARCGHQRIGGQTSPLKSDWLAAACDPWPRSLELLHSGSQYGIDLHASLVRDFFGVRRVRIEGDTEHVDVRGRNLRVLAQPSLLAFHALHASEGLDNLTMIRLVEIVLMVRRDAGRTFDMDELYETLHAAHATRFAWPAIALAERLAPGTFDTSLLSKLERDATPAMRDVVHRLQPADAQRLDVLTLRERFMWCHGPAEHARRLVHMLFPAPAANSPARLARLYVDRFRRLLKGTVELSRPDR